MKILLNRKAIHNINNQLMIISGNAELLIAKNPDNLKLKKNLLIIVESSRKITEILKENTTPLVISKTHK